MTGPEVGGRPARRAALPLLLALVLAGGGAILLAVGGRPSPSLPAPTDAAPTAAAPLRLRTEPPPSSSPAGPVAEPSNGPQAIPPSTGPTDLADPLAGPVPDAYLQQLLDATPSPVPTVLPAATTAAAIEAAGRVLVADLTGSGRDEFPGFWSEPTHSAWSRVRVQASTAQTAGLDPPRVAATLIWAGTAPTGEQVERRRTVITVELTGDGWWPVAVG